MPSPTSRRRVSVTEHPNVAAVRRLFDAFKAYDVAGVIDAIAEDAVWTFPGRRSKIAGEHRGREAVIKFLTKVMMLAGGTFSVKVHDIMASDDGAVVLFTGSAKRAGTGCHGFRTSAVIRFIIISYCFLSLAR